MEKCTMTVDVRVVDLQPVRDVLQLIEDTFQTCDYALAGGTARQDRIRMQLRNTRAQVLKLLEAGLSKG